jgi:hypothetical protein
MNTALACRTDVNPKNRSGVFQVFQLAPRRRDRCIRVYIYLYGRVASKRTASEQGLGGSTGAGRGLRLGGMAPTRGNQGWRERGWTFGAPAHTDFVK